MDDKAKIALIDLRETLLAHANKNQLDAGALVGTAKSEKQRFEAAKTIGIVQGYLESIKELDKVLAVQNV